MNFEYCEGKVHVISEGDSLYSISRLYNIPLALIMRANPYVDVYNLQVGTEVCIPVVMERPTRPDRPITMPGMEPVDMTGTIMSYVVKDGESLEDILAEFGIDLDDLLKFNTSNRIMLKPGTTIKIPEKTD